jgi:hypothetical protein
MKKKIYVCPNCGRALNFSEDTEYTFYCVDCGDYFHEYEAVMEEQSRMEGVKDFTELAEASMEIKAITDKAVQASTKQIEIKGKDIIAQICEYISETVKPIINSGIYKDYCFRDHARIYNGTLRLDFHDYGGNARGYQAQLFGQNGYLRVYFNGNNEYIIEQFDTSRLNYIVKDWAGFKETMNRMIAYGLRECDKANQKRIAEQEEVSKVIDSFRL